MAPRARRLRFRGKPERWAPTTARGRGLGSIVGGGWSTVFLVVGFFVVWIGLVDLRNGGFCAVLPERRDGFQAVLAGRRGLWENEGSISTIELM